MPSGYITSHIDVAQLVLYGFFIFFAGLVIYLRREDKREGYPLESDRSRRAPKTPIIGFPAPPPPKRWRMNHGEDDMIAPRGDSPADEIAGVIDSSRPLYGYPLQPSGDAMRDGVGPASYPSRRDIPDLTLHGEPKIQPLSLLPDYRVASGDPDPRGMTVIGADGVVAGTVEDLWVDRAEPRILYYQLALGGDILEDDHGSESDKRTRTALSAGQVLLPSGFARVQVRHNRIRVASILGSQFAFVPGVAAVDRITRLEEDRITAYFAGGQLYALPRRQEALL